MRREHPKTVDGDYLDYIRSLGCVLYLPLGEDGDKQDRISGNSLALVSGNVDMAWDSFEQMYLFTGPNYRNKSHTLDTGWTSATFPNPEVTVLTTFKKYPGQTRNGALLCTGDYAPLGGAAMQHGTSVMSNWNNSLFKCAYALSATGRWLYDNGALYASYGAHTPYLPQNWGGYNWFVGSCNSSNPGIKVYYKDILVFNRVLSLQEIRKVQGYE